MKTTLKMLEGACEPQRALFSELFGQEVELTLELCIEHAAKFNWYWAAENLLQPKARAAYYNAISTARADYKKALATACAEYDNAIAPARAAYNKAYDSARAEYDNAIAIARAKRIAHLEAALTRIKNLVDAPDIDPCGDLRQGLHCGLEDRCINDCYAAVDYGYSDGVDRALEWAVNEAEYALKDTP